MFECFTKCICNWFQSEYEKRSKKIAEGKIQARVKIKYLNIPDILDPKYQIIQNLVYLQDEKVILSDTIKVAIQYKHHRFASRYFTQNLLIFALLLGLFTAYILYYFQASNKAVKDANIDSVPCSAENRSEETALGGKILMMAIALWFIIRRWAIIKRWLKYAKASGAKKNHNFDGSRLGWAYFDFALFAAILGVLIYDAVVTSNEEDFYDNILYFYSILALFLWGRCFYMVRQYLEMGKFVHMIRKIIYDMELFLWFLLLLTLAFTHAFYLGKVMDMTQKLPWNQKAPDVTDCDALAQEAKRKGVKVPDFEYFRGQFNWEGLYGFIYELFLAYQMFLGQYNYDEEYDTKYFRRVLYLVFVIYTAFGIILLFNLLVAIMSTSFENV